MYKFNDIQTMMHAGAAILHAQRYHTKDLKDCSLFEKNFPLAQFLLQIGLINSTGMLTELGNEVFACPDLIKYYHLIQPELRFRNSKNIYYDYLRRGLNQHIQIHAIEYMDFIHSLEYVPLSVCDLGGGGGMYLRLVHEHFGCEPTLIDKDITYAQQNLPGDYNIEQADFLNSSWDPDDRYDMVLLNEVLHLQPTTERRQLIRLCHQLLNDDGWLIIGETEECSALNWRLSMLSAGSIIPFSTMMNLLNNEFKSNFSDEVVVLDLDTHYYIALRRT